MGNGRRVRWCVGIALVMCSAVALAAGPGAVRKQIESSMLVSGALDIDRDGRVRSIELKGRDGLPASVIELVEKAAQQWRFEPIEVDGRPAVVRMPMRLRLVAKKLDEDLYEIGIRSANFGSDAVHDPDDPRHVRADTLKPPVYPPALADHGVQGVVYLLLRIGRDGRVEDVVAEQVNLRIVASERQMRQARDMLAASAIRATRQWRFLPPTEGAWVGEPHWSARVPVDYSFGDGREREHGEWETYVPGPRRKAPWIAVPEEAEHFSPDVLIAGGTYPLLRRGPRLLTPLAGGS